MIELTLELAERVAQAARAKAREIGIGLTVVVVDEGGRVVLVARGDGTGILRRTLPRKGGCRRWLPPAYDADGLGVCN